MAAPLSASLRRDLGTIESYAAMLGMAVFWGAIGAALYAIAARRRRTAKFAPSSAFGTFSPDGEKDSR